VARWLQLEAPKSLCRDDYASLKRLLVSLLKKQVLPGEVGHDDDDDKNDDDDDDDKDDESDHHDDQTQEDSP
jgi:hypothetical protein